MWVIENGTLVHHPDDVPRPPGTVLIPPPPAEFHEFPQAYRIGKRGLIRRPEAEVAQLKGRAAAKLTQDEVLALKEALASGMLRPATKTAARLRREEKTK